MVKHGFLMCMNCSRDNILASIVKKMIHFPGTFFHPIYSCYPTAFAISMEPFFFRSLLLAPLFS